ncbi:hypothetical protein ON010_g17933 [Phytophthora cinnamomi]|nr:hypothetical protein ON010_g17933 [Phytophthora cinnamomi]
MSSEAWHTIDTAYDNIYNEKSRFLYDFWGPGQEEMSLYETQVNVGLFYVLWVAIIDHGDLPVHNPARVLAVGSPALPDSRVRRSFDQEGFLRRSGETPPARPASHAGEEYGNGGGIAGGGEGADARGQELWQNSETVDHRPKRSKHKCTDVATLRFISNDGVIRPIQHQSSSSRLFCRAIGGDGGFVIDRCCAKKRKTRLRRAAFHHRPKQSVQSNALDATRDAFERQLETRAPRNAAIAAGPRATFPHNCPAIQQHFSAFH